MKVALIPIGNSKGVRLPKAVLEQVGFGQSAVLEVERGRIVLTPERGVRKGWKEAFAAAASDLTAEDRAWLDAPLAADDAA